MWKSNNIRWYIRWTPENDEESNKQRKKTTPNKTLLVSNGGRWENGKSFSRRKSGQIEMKLQNHNFYCARHISVSSTHFFPHAALEFSSAGSLFPVYSTPPLHLQFSLLEKGEGEFLSLCEPWPHNASALCCVSICRALKRCAIKTNDTIRCYQYRIHKHSSTFTYILWLICDVYVIMSHR